MLDPGTRVEGYVVGRLLGEGGTASVYAVRHALLDTWHALKVLHTSDAATQDRLIREGRVQSRLDPALIVPVTDVILAHGAPALVLPLVRGMSLDSLLIDGPPTELEALSLFHAICTSVAHAHSHGIVHRDLKPANVLVDADQGRLRLRVADFGLVRAVADDELGANGGVRTRRGSMMGSPAYAAPEQLSDATRADRRADVWSLGVILYELLTGKRPFDGESLRDLIANVQNGDLNLDPVPTVHRAWIAQLLSVDPDGRPHNATEVLERVPAPEALPIDGPFGSRLVIPDLPAPPSVRSIAVTPPPAAPAIPDPAPRPTAVHAHIPAERSRLLGRAEDLKQLHAVVRSGARLATLTGIGGTGKTRLVIHFAWSVVEDWPGGVWFCDLTEARSLAGLASAVAGALGVVIDNGDPVARITDGLLARGRCLIVLDNFEQVTEHAAATVGRWLDGAPDSAFIITSREVLGVRGERVLPVPPLAPDSAVELFLERARAARPDFKPNESEKGFIEQLVTKMDHLPLAIELAAARVRTLSPERMLQRMDDRFRLLTTRGRKDRASTLRATLDWSWDLLDTPEKETLAQLSIFEGGFTLDAAEEIVQLSDPEAWVLDTVEALVDKSLVRTLPHERFGMLVTVQAYAQEKRQASPDPAGIIERHGRYFSNFGDPKALISLGQYGGTERHRSLNRELDNLLSALRRATDGATAAAAALAAWAIFIKRGPFSAGLQTLQLALEHPDVPPLRQVDLLRAIAIAHQRMGALDLGTEHCVRALELAEPLRDELRLAQVLNTTGVLTRQRGQLPEALALCERSLALCTSPDHRHQRCITLANRAVLLQTMGRVPESEAASREALELSRGEGNERQVGLILGNLGVLAGLQGRMDEAGVQFAEALVIAQRIEARRTETFLLINLGIVASRQGRHQDAVTRFDAAYDMTKIMGERGQQAASLGYLAEALTDQGRTDHAKETFERLLILAEQLGNPRRQGAAHGGLGILNRLMGRLDTAQHHLNQAIHFHEKAGMTPRIPMWHLQMALVEIARGDLQKATVELATATQGAAPFPPVAAEVWLGQARLQLAKADFEAAHAAVARARTIGVQERTRALLYAVQAAIFDAEGHDGACTQAVAAALENPAWTSEGTEVAAMIAALTP